MPDTPKKRAPTAGTRRGNGPGQGPGWGGPAKGPGRQGAVPGSGRKPGVPLHETKAARARALLEDAAPLAAQVVVDIATSAADPRALAAALALLNRVGVHEKAGLEHSGPDGRPLTITEIRRVIVDPKGA